MKSFITSGPDQTAPLESAPSSVSNFKAFSVYSKISHMPRCFRLISLIKSSSCHNKA